MVYFIIIDVMLEGCSVQWWTSQAECAVEDSAQDVGMTYTV